MTIARAACVTPIAGICLGLFCAATRRSNGSLPRALFWGFSKNGNARIGESSLLPGDTLVLYTDGVTEAFNDQGEEFGEQRLVDSLRRHRDLRPRALMNSILEDVRQFSPHEQHDDITLVVARCAEDENKQQNALRLGRTIGQLLGLRQLRPSCRELAKSQSATTS